MKLSRVDFTTADAVLHREWLVTNGLGGFASGTVAQANTRRYHALLVAALRPPVDRIVMVAKLDAAATYRGQHFDLATNEYSDSTLAPRGFESLSEFRLEGTTPVWTFALADAVLEQRVWMANGKNTTYVSFTLRAAAEHVDLELLPLCTYRDYHAHARGPWNIAVESGPRGCKVTSHAGAHPFRLTTDRGSFEGHPDWYWNCHHRAEAERGLDSAEDLFRPGFFRARLAPGQTLTVTATAESDEPESPHASLMRETRRQKSLLRSTTDAAPEWIRQLTLAADQFITQRWKDGKPVGTTVIAGYPWFSDWGRDTMIALPGLALATGRASEAAATLRTFAAHTSDGMLPNRFPDNGEAPEYNTVDAALWYFHAIDAYLEETGDARLLRDLYPTLREIVDWHRRGTRYGIHVDPADGLLVAGEPGVQLTWMDAKIGDWVVTPRTGKPVEINALWHFALTRMARWATALTDKANAASYSHDAARVATSFANAFWYAEGGYLYDVVDAPREGSDASLRPNQIFAVSLGTDLLPMDRARNVVGTCARHLLTPVGLRSLAPTDPRYVGTYTGGPRERDAVYHQGAVWGWLLGPFALAHYAVHGDLPHAIALLDGISSHLGEACLGSINEIFDGDAPHRPRGCFAQAWSVSETLRAWHFLNRRRSASEPALISRGNIT
jgi:predicted glycogen debranching enzyme